MSGTVFCVAVVMLGVKFSVQPLPSGGVEYVIHVEPLDVESLRAGNDLRSDLPPSARDVRSFHITLASDQPAAVPGPGPSLFGPDSSTVPPKGSGSLLSSTAPPGADGRSATARAAKPGAFNFPESGKFPATPPGTLPMPKIDVNPIRPETPFPPAKSEPAPFAAAKMPPLSTTFKPMAEPPSLTSSVPKGKSLPAAEKPEPPQASSQTAVQASEPEVPKRPSGLLYSLAASTIGSFSGMAFFGWVAWDYRKRYYSLLSRFMPSAEEPESAEEDPSASADDEAFPPTD